MSVAGRISLRVGALYDRFATGAHDLGRRLPCRPADLTYRFRRESGPVVDRHGRLSRRLRHDDLQLIAIMLRLFGPMLELPPRVAARMGHHVQRQGETNTEIRSLLGPQAESHLTVVCRYQFRKGQGSEGRERLRRKRGPASVGPPRKWGHSRPFSLWFRRYFADETDIGGYRSDRPGRAVVRIEVEQLARPGAVVDERGN